MTVTVLFTPLSFMCIVWYYGIVRYRQAQLAHSCGMPNYHPHERDSQVLPTGQHFTHIRYGGLSCPGGEVLVPLRLRLSCFRLRISVFNVNAWCDVDFLAAKRRNARPR